LNQFLESVVFHFFTYYLDPSRPLLLGISGGADSLCLLHLFLKWKSKNILHLVHVDHGWRVESKEEAKSLQALAASHGLAFHTKRLDPSAYKGNLENESRKERIAFFTEVARLTNAQGILLGHHADDQAETVLKRLFEGSSLSGLHGILPKTEIGDLTILRPLLKVTKAEILAWLESHDISYFTDKTNSDTKFLRARMREKFFPFLQDIFGKQCARNFVEIAKEAGEIQEHVDTQLASNLKKIIASDLGYLLEIEYTGMDRFLCRNLVRKFCKEACFEISRVECERIRDALMQKEANICVEKKGRSVVADRGWLFYIKKKKETNVYAPCPLYVGEEVYEGWQVTTKIIEREEKVLLQNSWKDVWQGKCSTVLPKGTYTLWLGCFQLRRKMGAHSRVMSKLLNDNKVPHVLWSFSPCILQGEYIVEDFLTKTLPERSECESLYIVMQRIRQT
jgi:tRNA(Ile)-lysidine synthase